MSRYDRISLTNFVKEMLQRFDGVIAVIVMIAFAICAILAPTVGLKLGQLEGEDLTYGALAMIPVVFLYYSSLVYFSSSGAASILINSILILLVPALFVYFT